MKCNKCGKEVSGEGKLCVECTTNINNAKPASCPNCGFPNKDQRSDCYKCGYTFKPGETARKNINPSINSQQEGLFESLFSFERMLSIKIIKIVYFLGLIGIAISAIIAFISLSSGRQNIYGQQQGGSYLLSVAVAAGILVIGTLVWRIICEGLIVIFSINDKLADIKELLKK